MSSGLQLSGLASGFDWKTFTDSIISAERAPAQRYQAEQAKNDSRKSQLSSLGSMLTTLQTAASALSSTSLASGRKVANESSSATIKATVSSSTPVGSYEVQVSHLATASRLTGSVFIPPTVVEGNTLTLLGTAKGDPTPITITADMTVSAIVSAINASGAGITAMSNKAGTQLVLTNRTTGSGNDIVVGGSLKSALGLDTIPLVPGPPVVPSNLTLGSDTNFTINGVSFTSKDVTIDSTDHGIAGLSFKAGAIMALAETLTVSTDSSDMKGKINTFVSAYNSVADFIDSASAYTTKAGKTTAGPLADNREIQSWLKDLRSTAFRAPASGGIKNLSALGLDFTSKDSRITVTDSAKLDTALADHPGDVATFFNKTTTGLASSFVTKLNTFIGSDGITGQLSTKLQSYTKANESLDAQIVALDAYLATRRSQLEAGFMAMESAQSKIKQMQTQLTNSFGQKNSTQ